MGQGHAGLVHPEISREFLRKKSPKEKKEKTGPINAGFQLLLNASLGERGIGVNELKETLKG